MALLHAQLADLAQQELLQGVLHYQPIGVAPNLQLVQQVLHSQPHAMVPYPLYLEALTINPAVQVVGLKR